MSQAFSPRSVIRCPLCHDGAKPEHMGHGVSLCVACGNRFRVVHANRGRTGERLYAAIEQTTELTSRARERDRA